LQYPAVELLVGIGIVVLFQIYGATSEFIFACAFFSLMIPVAVIDWRHYLIPNMLVVSGIVIGLIMIGMFSPEEVWPRIAASLFAYCLLLAIRFLGNRLFHKPAMGMGDVKLASLVGLFIGLQGFLVALWLASFIGAIFGVIMKLSGRGRPASSGIQQLASSVGEVTLPGSIIPFGSFLAVSSFVTMVMQEPLTKILGEWSTLLP
jgi:leader peptidase (prepilin peptidase) / N-methyltransferase